MITELIRPSMILVDAVRIPSQIEAFRIAFGSRVVHIHLTASEAELERRYKKRSGRISELGSYAELRQSETERNVDGLATIADVVIKTDRCTDRDVLIRAAARLGLYPRAVVPLVDILVGGQYGSEGKGHISSFLATEYAYLVRVGGPNAGHKVYRGKQDEPYTFHQLPSGTITSEARLIIGPGANISLDALFKEIADCKVSAERLSIDPQAMIIEKQDLDFEKRYLEKEISSTAQGVGAATARRINGRGGAMNVKLAKDIKDLRPFVRSTGEILERAYLKEERIFLEGTQGTSLSIYHGPYPKVTSRDTTVSGCLAEAGISAKRVRRVVMVCRTYPIRVGGDSGPMSQEISFKEIAHRSGLSFAKLKKTERTSTTNKDRRVGEFDWEQLRRSTVLNGPTDLALTFVDYIQKSNTEARRFEQLTIDTINFVEEVERVSGVPVSLISTRFHFRSIIDRRAW
jgi:adenylosuccinate synthase